MSEHAPVHWDRLTLGEVTKWKSGGTPSKSNPEYWGGDVPWISAKSMKNFFLFDSEDRITKEAVANGARLVEPGDILMLVRGMTLNNDVPICVATRQMAFNQDVKSIRGINGTNSRFVTYWLLANKALLLSLVDQASHGTGRFRMDVLLSMKMQLPPLPEQRAIASVLGALDDKIELNRRMNKTLEDMAAAIFKAWFVDFEPVRAKASGAASFAGMPQEVFDSLPSGFEDSELGEIPEGWEVKPLSNCVDILSGGTPKRSNELFWGGEHAWYSVRDAPSDGDVWVTDTSEKITTEGLEGSAASLLPTGITIISARGTVGKLALTSIPMAMNQSCYGLAGVGHWGSFFTYWTSRQAVLELKQKTHGSVFDTITRDTFKKVDVICPNDFVNRGFEYAVETAMSLIQENLVESRTLAETRDTLLPKLLSGEVRVDNQQSNLGRL